jgi:hypothetical protein
MPLIVYLRGCNLHCAAVSKTAASRRLNKIYPDEDGRKRWTRHGSTRYLWTEEAVAEKVVYVLDGQGEPMERFPAVATTPSRARSGAE